MSQNYTHNCIKCATQYTDTDPDPYYCQTCNEARKALARQVDQKMAGRTTRREHSALKEYDSAPKIGGFIHVKL